jgi:hypothetical protein
MRSGAKSESQMQNLSGAEMKTMDQVSSEAVRCKVKWSDARYVLPSANGSDRIQQHGSCVMVFAFAEAVRHGAETLAETRSLPFPIQGDNSDSQEYPTAPVELVSTVQHKAIPIWAVDYCLHHILDDLQGRENHPSNIVAVAFWQNVQRVFVAVVESVLGGRKLMRCCPIHKVVAVFE